MAFESFSFWRGQSRFNPLETKPSFSKAISIKATIIMGLKCVHRMKKGIEAAEKG